MNISIQRRIGLLALLASALFVAHAQEGLPQPSALEHQLAARANSVSEVSLDKSMLGFAASFMSKSKDADEARQLIQNLNGIYVRNYTFDKPGEFSPADAEALRHQFDNGNWKTMVRENDKRGNSYSEVLVRISNNQTTGMFIFSAQPKEISLVFILGNISINDLGKLKGINGLGSLSNVPHKDGTR